jgi:RNA polymerase sigma factor FliA
MATAVMTKQMGFIPAPATANEELIQEHFSLVKYLASRLGAKLPPSVEIDDLVSAGVMGLMDAAEKFDPSRGIRFRTYAERRIRGAILDHLRSLDWAPRSLRRRVRAFETAHGRLERDLGRSVTTAEVANFMEIGLDEIHGLAFEVNTLQVTSLQSCLESEDDHGDTRELVEKLADRAEHSPYDVYARAELREHLTTAIGRLPDKERLVVSLYYVDELTMKEIGAVLGVNESRVSQLHTKAISRLRTALVCLDD